MKTYYYKAIWSVMQRYRTSSNVQFFCGYLLPLLGKNSIFVAK